MADFSKALADLQATPFKRFTDNFIQVETAARGSAVTGRPEDGNLDWFDRNWAGIAENGAVVAWLAKEAGFKGLFLDVEHYTGSLGPWEGKHIFDYASSPSKDQHKLEEVAAQIQLRGRQFMHAVAEAYPDITIIIIQNTGWGKTQPGGVLRAGGCWKLAASATIDRWRRNRLFHLITHKEFASLREGAESRARTGEVVRA